jgi:hypothetical protein
MFLCSVLGGNKNFLFPVRIYGPKSRIQWLLVVKLLGREPETSEYEAGVVLT